MKKMKVIKNWFVSMGNRIKWLFTEIVNMYSATDSYFSKKRVESGVAFLIAQFGMVFFLIKKIESMDVYELSIWAGMEFLIAGYTVNQIQKEKKTKEEFIEDSDDPMILND
jgi:hypothetical protein